jgi:hypothetical protein
MITPSAISVMSSLNSFELGSSERNGLKRETSSVTPTMEP